MLPTHLLGQNLGGGGGVRGTVQVSNWPSDLSGSDNEGPVSCRWLAATRLHTVGTCWTKYGHKGQGRHMWRGPH